MRKEVKRPETCPNCGGTVIAVEYWWGSPEHYDGISEYACVNAQKCGFRLGRWSGKVIPSGYVESRYGDRGEVPIITPKKQLRRSKR